MSYVKNMRSGYGVVLAEKQLFLIVPEEKVSSEQIKEYISTAKEYAYEENPMIKDTDGNIIFCPNFSHLLNSFIQFMKIEYKCEVIRIID